ncbi:hypothetical protein [Gordonia sp. 852002-50395_SCH5434458]|uniref:hypothetical protein n=1 Tax=Gordonia sp. 852002-50395_SCH5434458 TaxID=1834090 RepID=UPI0007EA740D|nr:hypothetical protein [Gordonia sp. 852002-50395_SCH5434458]OBC01733.1 hypothetical protein A5785_17190 [Gordonia sp. 852002-50395_SCH5434458]
MRINDLRDRALAVADRLTVLPGALEYRWERERSRELAKGERPASARRRRSQLLSRKADRRARSGIGVGAATTGDDVVPPWWRRALAEQDAGESLSRMIAMGALGAVVAALVGVGVGAGRGIYWLMERCSPRIGRLWWSPWATAAVVVGAALWFLGLLTGPSLKLIPRFPMLWPDLSFGEWVTSWASWQLVIALGATAYFVHAWGWAAVPRKAVEPSKQNADGTWREIPEGQKIDIGYDPSALPVYVPPEPFDDDCIGDEAGFVPGEDEEIR